MDYNYPLRADNIHRCYRLEYSTFYGYHTDASWLREMCGFDRRRAFAVSFVRFVTDITAFEDVCSW